MKKSFTAKTQISLYKEHPVLILNPESKPIFMIGFKKANLILANAERIVNYIEEYSEGDHSLMLDENDFDPLVLDINRCYLIVEKYKAIQDFVYNSDGVIEALSSEIKTSKKLLDPEKLAGFLQEFREAMGIKKD